MKITYRIPTEMYAYVEIEEDYKDVMPVEKIRELYTYYSEINKVQPANSLPDKEHNGFIDRMLLGEENHIEDYNKMSPQQQSEVQTIKRALKRIKSRE